jgi:hypothetical protein
MTIKASRYSSTSDARRQYLSKVDSLAGRIRARHFTDVTGQPTTYEFKRQDAERYIAEGEPSDTSPYPWVEAEADAINSTASEAARNIKNRSDALWQGGVDIERERRRGKVAVKNAATVREMYNTLEDARQAMESVSESLSNSGS